MQIAIITGGSSGIGRATALQLARRQLGVILTYRTRAAEAGAVADEIAREGGTAAALPLDVADLASHAAFADRVRDTLRGWRSERFDVLVNNAGVGGAMPFVEATEAYFDAMYGANLKGPFFLTQQLLPLLADGGQIVNVSSSAARQVSVPFSVYGPSKAALTALTRYLAKELAPRKIRVNSVSPGPVLTNFGDGAFAKHPEYIEPLAAQTLIGRIAQPDDIAGAVAALVSDGCRYLTGSDLDVSGGFMM